MRNFRKYVVVSIVLIVKGSYIKSVIDGDPGYEKLKEKTALLNCLGKVILI